MLPTPATPGIAETLRREASLIPGLVAAYLFGSAARAGGEPRDVDVALVWSEAVVPKERWARGESLATRLEACAALGGLAVDLVDLRRAPPSLQVRVLREGMRVFEGDAVARVRFEATTLSRALEYLEWEKPYREQWLRRVAEGR